MFTDALLNALKFVPFSVVLILKYCANFSTHIIGDGNNSIGVPILAQNHCRPLTQRAQTLDKSLIFLGRELGNHCG